MNKTVVITGATGFIGSHTAKAFKSAGYKVIAIDEKFTIPESTKFFDDLIIDDYVNMAASVAVINDADAIIHIAATSLVGPSIMHPHRYYDNNVSKTNRMMNDLIKHDWKGKIIFSSSAAVYGNQYPHSEDVRKDPINPYGRTKLMGEYIIEDSCYISKMRGIALRYFNACGCDIDGELGNVKYDSHIIPVLIEKLLSKDKFTINGNDFDTKDGTCVRDYLHVTDIANAHLEAVCLAESFDCGKFDVYNLSTGIGYSNLDIVMQAEQILGKKLNYQFGPKREGDPNALVANPEKFMKATSWKPYRSDLETIIKSTYEWMKKFDFSEE